MSMSTSTSTHTDGGPTLRGERPDDDQNSVSNSNEDGDVDVDMDDAEHEVDELADAKPKKKRRVVKTFDKKYECPAPDCGKAYSRAEHLYRHQLNHTPKQIYHCDFPGCDRHFVRADLCARHKERHTAKGSHLQRKDAFMNSQRGSIAAQTQNASAKGPNSPPGSAKVSMSNTSPVDSAHAVPSSSSTHAEQFHMAPPNQAAQQPYATAAEQYSNHPVLPQLPPMQVEAGASVDPQLSASGSYSSYSSSYNASGAMDPPPSSNGTRRYSMEGQFSRPGSMQNGFAQNQQMPVGAMHPPPLPPLASPQSSGPAYSQSSYQSPGSNFRSPQNYSNLPSLPPFDLSQNYGNPGGARTSNTMSPPPISMDQYQVTNSRGSSVVDFNIIDQFGGSYALPVFNSDGFNRSPPIYDEALFNQLLESGGIDLSVPSPPPQDLYEPQIPSSIPPPRSDTDSSKVESSASTKTWDTDPPLSNGMDLTMRESILTERKQARIISLVRSFEELENMPGRKLKEEILRGDTTDDHHALSVNMMKTYITSYWIHIHQQMPILHRPTFNTETCPDLLLLAIMCLGACCLERTHNQELIKTCAELAFFSAYHIRWEVFKDAEFRPTAKLWTFQTMLLLELFEKMYSTRALHERAHIHHATTLTVMRRGSSLIGRSANETTSAGTDPTRTPPGPEGTINTSGVNTADAYWNRWITAEATRRVAFAAFIIDSTHATLFGHSAVMSPHDIRLPLPCDEALWSATSSAEVQRVEASLAANGFKPTSFLEGLKMTLNGHKVRTNVFGRVILMAGLLNVSWHMNQRDLQITSLGAGSTLGNPMRWRSSLTRAFDFWRRDFDESLTKTDQWSQVWNPQTKSTCHADHHDNVFESRTCLHSLAHMAMHVDIVDCEVFAGADRALGRIVTEGDRAAVQRRMRDHWAPSARARDAVFYALRFLCEVLMPEGCTHEQRTANSQPNTFNYSARDDYLLNRPWILYFAMMTVWSYGFALDGPIANASDYRLTTRELQTHDARRYLLRVGTVMSPDDLENLKDRNACLGLLILLQECFRQPRWELLHEASNMMGLCINLSSGKGDVKNV